MILIEAASAFSELITSGRCAKLDDPLGRINGYASRAFSAHDYLHIQRVRTFLQQRIDKLFDEFDVIAAPGEDTTAEPLNPPAAPKNRTHESSRKMDSKQPDAISSLCGLPALTVPSGFSKDNLPMGIQFMARALDDQRVVEAANLFQSHTDWHKRRPPID